MCLPKISLVVCIIFFLSGCIFQESLLASQPDFVLLLEEAPFFELQTLYSNGRTRDPRIVVAMDGSVLAFGAGNLRRSENGGRTWSDSVESVGDRQVVDEQSEDVLSVSLRQEKMWRSSDHGKTWKEESITVVPNAQMEVIGEVAELPASVSFGGCESGIMIRHGDGGLYGRLLMPARYWPYGSNAIEYRGKMHNTSVYSDDGGQTWKVSTFFPDPWTGEGTLAELSDGRVYYNSRTHNPDTTKRRMAWSYDSGETWTDLEIIEDLFDGGGYGRGYGCNAGLVRLPLEWTRGKDVLLFSQPDTQGGVRERMTVWASFDGGKTWPLKRLVYEGPSAYSSLAVGRPGTPSDGLVFLLFEGGPEGRYSAIQVARFNLSWLMETLVERDD